MKPNEREWLARLNRQGGSWTPDQRIAALQAVELERMANGIERLAAAVERLQQLMAALVPDGYVPTAFEVGPDGPKIVDVVSGNPGG